MANAEYPDDWDDRRRRVYRRDDYTCQNCGRKGGPHGEAELHAHHVVPKSNGGSHSLSNLRTLCRACHDRAHEHDIFGHDGDPAFDSSVTATRSSDRIGKFSGFSDTNDDSPTGVAPLESVPRAVFTFGATVLFVGPPTIALLQFVADAWPSRSTLRAALGLTASGSFLIFVVVAAAIGAAVVVDGCRRLRPRGRRYRPDRWLYHQLSAIPGVKLACAVMFGPVVWLLSPAVVSTLLLLEQGQDRGRKTALFGVATVATSLVWGWFWLFVPETGAPDVFGVGAHLAVLVVPPGLGVVYYFGRWATDGGAPHSTTETTETELPEEKSVDGADHSHHDALDAGDQTTDEHAQREDTDRHAPESVVPPVESLLDHPDVLERYAPGESTLAVEGDVVRPLLRHYDPEQYPSPSSPEGVERILDILERDTPIDLGRRDGSVRAEVARDLVDTLDDSDTDRYETTLVAAVGSLCETLRRLERGETSVTISHESVNDGVEREFSTVRRNPHPPEAPDDVPAGPDCELSYDDIDRGSVIGRGGQAVVYEATARTPDGEVPIALKQPRRVPDTGSIDQFTREAKTWADLDDNDHIVDVVGWGTDPEPWLALEFMDGGTLGDVAGSLPLTQALWTAVSIADGLDHIHTRGVRHFDIKPSNVLFRAVEDGWNVPKISDMGLARQMLGYSQRIEGFAFRYAAPEEFDGEMLDEETDIYTFGATCYELFTGTPPFSGTRAEIIARKLSGDVVPPSEHDPSIPDPLEEIIMTAMAVEPTDRYPSVDRMRYLLAGLLTEARTE